MPWYLVAALLTLLASYQGILTTLSQSHGKYRYDYATVPFLAEVFKVKGCGEASCDSLFSAPIQGYMLGLLSACLSALAGVYTEYLMKKNNDSLYWQNVQLYMFGTIFNMAWLKLDDFRAGFEYGPWWQRLLDGYTVTTWLVVLNLGSSGLLVSWLMKYADNIVKMYFALAQTLVDLPATTNLALDTVKEIAAERRGES
ncbi:CMP-sialic acid transporter 1-like [Musa acuminata AAA Group]|uniref:CMP-sialic acid transporter 1-like n=1 Tax=Musa acuminata AAA Group TaxID=214697 RepID=UPI0031DD05EB